MKYLNNKWVMLAAGVGIGIGIGYLVFAPATPATPSTPATQTPPATT